MAIRAMSRDPSWIHPGPSSGHTVHVRDSAGARYAVVPTDNPSTQRRGSLTRIDGSVPMLAAGTVQETSSLASEDHEAMLTLSSDSVQALPVDERGLAVLKDLLEEREWNEYSYLLRYKRSPGVASAVAESLAWLRGRAFIARSTDQPSDAAIFVTARGREALAHGLATVRAVEHLEAGLHPLLEQRVRRQFLLGEYEQAVFVAMKAVEVRVRSLAGLGDDMIGVALMTKAFNTDGPLTDPAAVPGERVGTMNLFQGAYAVLRNPAGHREVNYDDVTEAAEAVATASLLMRILDRVEERLSR